MPHTNGFNQVRHEAMGTEFWITSDHADRRYARQAAREAFEELDRLESVLSQFIENSDVARLNRLGPGQSLVVDPSTRDCLRTALQIEKQTDGAFNVAYGSRPRRPAAQAIALDSRRPIVTVVGSGVKLDLGGLGKGFALDHMAKLLRDWDIDRVLFRGSASTLLAGDPPAEETGWPIRFGPHDRPSRLRLANAALSGSGTAVKGEHIIDPRTGMPARHRTTAWASAPTAVVADALSTAFMVMSAGQIRNYCIRHRDIAAYVLDKEGNAVQSLGDTT
jgi:thiamine biosynthesis lipoprotein